MPREAEVKFLQIDPDAVRASLRESKAGFLGRRFEQNLVFDTPQRSLRQQDILLRLRQDGDATLTLKRRPRHPGPPGVKVKDEIETRVADFEATRTLLQALGYDVAFRYEKIRETWRLYSCTVCLDTLPFGDFLELEAGDRIEDLEQAARALGLDPTQASSATYHELNQDYRRRNALPPDESFVFQTAPEFDYPSPGDSLVEKDEA